MPPLRHGFWPRLALSLLLAAAIVVPIAVVATSALRQNARLDALGSRNPAAREIALNQLIRDASQNPKLVPAAASRLANLPDDAVMPVVRALAEAGVAQSPHLRDALTQRLPTLPHDAFLAAFDFLEQSDAPLPDAALDLAVQRLTTPPPAEAQLKQLVARLDRHGTWASPPVPQPLYIAWITRAAEAQSPALREQTAQQLGDLPITQHDLDLTRVTPTLRKLLTDESPSVRYAALSALAGYALQHQALLEDLAHAQSDSDPAVAEWAVQLFAAAQTPPQPTPPPPPLAAEAITDDNRLAVWRNILAANPSPQAQRWWNRLIAESAATPALRPLRLAAIFRLRTLPPGPAATGPAASANTPADFEELLAALEGCPAGSVALDFSPEMPHLVRIAAAHAASNAQPSWLRGTLGLDDRPAVRDAACLVAAQRFDEAQIASLIGDLLASHDHDARVSAAILSGLTAVGSDLIRNAAAHETHGATRRMFDVGLWMQGDAPQLDSTIAAMLGRAGLPESTLVLAMLHHGDRRAALDHLLTHHRLPAPSTPTSKPAFVDSALPAWVIQERWLRVLTAYLPPEAPPLDGWADPAWFAQQTQNLRAWHAVHRHRPAP